MVTPFQLGNTIIQARSEQRSGAPLTMVNVHDDENTAVQAGVANIEKYGGRVIELVHSGERLITFSLGEERFVFDPNRMFSDRGIEATLLRHSTYSEAAQAAIREFATAYLRQFELDSEKVLVALHNVTEGFFSVEAFLPGEYLSADAAAVHVSPRHSRFDFFFVTQADHYEWLKQRDFNVVLQDNERVEDDGSLSVYCAQKGIPYLNVEAHVEHLREQLALLEAVRELLGHPSKATPVTGVNA